jgi:hypothetical protein
MEALPLLNVDFGTKDEKDKDEDIILYSTIFCIVFM